MTDLFWARVIVGGVDRGGGVALAPRLLVTAAHCVQGVEVGDAESAIEVAVAGRPPVSAVLQERADRADLALLRLDEPLVSSVRLPHVSGCRRGDPWFAPARPRMTDPELDGHVSSVMLYDCQAGARIEAIQLTTSSVLGNYAGYSGGPVFLEPEDRNRVAGILIEQYPDQVDHARATNVLFAASAQEALDQFNSLSTRYLLRLAVAGNSAEPRARTEDRAPIGPAATAMTTDEVQQRHLQNLLSALIAAGELDPESLPIHLARFQNWLRLNGDDDGQDATP